MTTDITRSTFQPFKHYSGVLQQQGRVQLDADWNEQIAIEAHRDQTVTRDVVGSCGAPMENAGFGMIDGADLSAEEQARLADLGILPLANGDFLIGHGRFYVDGILCENEETISFVHQPDLLDGTPVAAGRYLIYLDVWQRHITALEDPSIREVALGGPDTTTRLKTIWQVKAMPVADEGDGTHCLSTFSDWTDLVTPTSASLNARGAPESAETGPCIVPPGAGFRRLENQLYRVEIHRSGDIGEATFKWSRINASTVSAWLGQSGTDQERLQISSTGPDDLLGFAGGRSVELTDDARELRNESGTLVALTRVDENILTIDPASRLHPAEDSIDRADFPHNPKIRRWDSPKELPVETPAENGGWIPLEDGVEIRFETGPYESGQYWLIPARTLTGEVEWPRDAGDPVPQPPHGIEHHFGRLALIDAVETASGLQLTPVDCRPIFPPLTQMNSFFYLSGDGQEAMPDLTAPGAFLPLAGPLQVGVANGQEPVSGATVRFTVTEGNGRVQGSTGPIDVTSGTDGVATCAWELDSATQSQQVEAVLLDAAGSPVHLPIRFNANLSRASAVAYDPSDCPDLAESGVKTVQQAIDRLCQMGGGPAEEPGIHIEKVFLLSGADFANDIEVNVEALLEGIGIGCDAPVEPDTIKRPTVYVTLDIPYPYQPNVQVSFWGAQGFLGFQPIILDANLKVDRETILWRPTDSVKTWLSEHLFIKLRELGHHEPILTHLTLKGNFIWSAEDPNLYLDGDTLGTPPGETENNLLFPSGDGKRGGDFGMWFWLVP